MTPTLTDPLHPHSVDQPENLAACESVSRSTRQTRLLAVDLHNHQMPEFSKLLLVRRWKVSADSVRKILRANGVDSSAEKDSTIPLATVLLWEQISDPLMTWFLSSLEGRKVLSADLLTPEEVCNGRGSLPPMHINSLYRHLEDGRLKSIRIGKQHRFRRDVKGALAWPGNCAEMPS